ncbi:MAG: GNAT family N-acetyltransferase [Deltaproteobacteria bacterium]|nr:GNAT family N-acetyltransferase [Deltaproteobacteria bacterium]
MRAATNITISPFTIDLYNSVFALWKQSEGVGLSRADSRECIKSYLERNPGMSFVATNTGGKVVGAILAGHDGRRGYIHHLSVHHDFRRQGLASRLVGKSLQKLTNAELQKCHIFIFNDNANGIEFWKNIGWVHRSDISVISKNIEQVV